MARDERTGMYSQRSDETTIGRRTPSPQHANRNSRSRDRSTRELVVAAVHREALRAVTDLAVGQHSIAAHLGGAVARERRELARDDVSDAWQTENAIGR